MNQEKIQALFEEVVVAADELKKATAAANKIKVSNSKEQTIQKLVSDFNAIQQNSTTITDESRKAIKRLESKYSELEDKADKAIKRVEKKSSLPNFIAFFSVLILSIAVGLGVGFYLFTEHLDDYAYKKYLNIKYGVTVFPNGLALPEDFKNRLGKTNEGVYFITPKN
ncbi:hypothetical protein I3256_18780 [Photobacterium damselae]|uniref:hypothetical protein n=1 Tax=Photobacterium damselae TaxID=38293 RepID=UPI001EE01599|nr:hypothetical protein [Photobacterium damselae]MCG3817989.1 hypothetical protein [Photobacterium damselae]